MKKGENWTITGKESIYQAQRTAGQVSSIPATNRPREKARSTRKEAQSSDLALLPGKWYISNSTSEDLEGRSRIQTTSISENCMPKINWVYMMGKVEPAEEEVAGANTQDAKQILMNLQAKKMQVMIITDDHGMALPVEPIGTKIESLVIECIVAIDITQV